MKRTDSNVSLLSSPLLSVSGQACHALPFLWTDAALKTPLLKGASPPGWKLLCLHTTTTDRTGQGQWDSGIILVGRLERACRRDYTTILNTEKAKNRNRLPESKRQKGIHHACKPVQEGMVNMSGVWAAL